MNGKISPDVQRIARLRDDAESASEDASPIAAAIVEVAYQIAMFRGDIADLMDADEARYKKK